MNSMNHNICLNIVKILIDRKKTNTYNLRIENVTRN